MVKFRKHLNSDVWKTLIPYGHTKLNVADGKHTKVSYFDHHIPKIWEFHMKQQFKI